MGFAFAQADGLAKGEAQGKIDGQAAGETNTLLLLLEKKFGPPTAELRERVESLTADRRREVTLAILDAESLDELGLAGD